jgi:hypothetical protein
VAKVSFLGKLHRNPLDRSKPHQVVTVYRSLQEALLQAGLAWWYRKYAPKDKKLAALEAEAQKAKRGLWVEPNPVAPWDWRRGKCQSDSHCVLRHCALLLPLGTHAHWQNLSQMSQLQVPPPLRYTTRFLRQWKMCMAQAPPSARPEDCATSGQRKIQGVPYPRLQALPVQELHGGVQERRCSQEGWLPASQAVRGTGADDF